MDRDHIDWERLDRYVTGQGTPEERAALEAWVNTDPELRAIAAAMRTAGRPPAAEERQWDVRGAWQRLRRRMARAPLRAVSSAHAGLSARSRSPWFVGAAAAVVVLVAGSLFVVMRWHRGPVEMREVATRRGQTAALYLPDGSRVTLGPESRLRLSTSIGLGRSKTPRDIYLDGEAYLDVKHDSTRPFQVHTAGGVVQDIGTEFLVTAYRETRGVRVVVASGAVALYRPPTAGGGQSPPSGTAMPVLTLVRGDLAELGASGIATVTRGVNVTPYISWTQGNLTFDGTRLRDAIPQLERWYDVEFRLADSSLGDRRLTATFRHESLSQVLELLGLSLDARVEQHGRSVLLEPKSHQGSVP